MAHGSFSEETETLNEASSGLSPLKSQSLFCQSVWEKGRRPVQTAPPDRLGLFQITKHGSRNVIIRLSNGRGTSCQRSTLRLSEDKRPIERVTTARWVGLQNVERAHPRQWTLILQVTDSKLPRLRLSFSGRIV